MKCRNQRGPKLALVFRVYFLWLCIFVTDARLHFLRMRLLFSFSVLSQEIGWKERLRNDLFYVGWDVEP